MTDRLDGHGGRVAPHPSRRFAVPENRRPKAPISLSCSLKIVFGSCDWLAPVHPLDGRTRGHAPSAAPPHDASSRARLGLTWSISRTRDYIDIRPDVLPQISTVGVEICSRSRGYML